MGVENRQSVLWVLNVEGLQAVYVTEQIIILGICPRMTAHHVSSSPHRVDFIIKTSYYPLIRFHFLHKNQCRTIYLINTIEQILKFSICCKERMIYMITALKSSIGNGLRRAVTSITLPKINISALCFRSTCIKAFHSESELIMSIVVYMIPTCR